VCSLFVPKDETEETLLLLLISESIVRNRLVFHLVRFAESLFATEA